MVLSPVSPLSGSFLGFLSSPLAEVFTSAPVFCDFQELFIFRRQPHCRGPAVGISGVCPKPFPFLYVPLLLGLWACGQVTSSNVPLLTLRVGVQRPRALQSGCGPSLVSLAPQSRSFPSSLEDRAWPLGSCWLSWEGGRGERSLCKLASSPPSRAVGRVARPDCFTCS